MFSFPPSYTPKGVIDAVFSGFTKATGIKVNQIPEPADYPTFVQKITAALGSGYAGYDVIYSDDFTIQSFAAAGWLIPLNGHVAQSSITALNSAHQKLSSYKSQMYRIPTNHSFNLLFYRKDLLMKAGVAVPQTWSELLSAARALTKNGHYGIGLGGQPNWAINDFAYYMPQAGGSLLNLELPGSQKALEFLHDLVSVHKVVPASYPTDGDDLANYFQSGYTSLWAGWNGYINQYIADPKFYLGGKTVGIATPAKGPVNGATNIGDWGWSISKFSPRQNAAVRFVDYMTTKSAEIDLARSQQIPARQDAVAASAKVLIGGTDIVRILSQVTEVPRPTSPGITQIQDNAVPILVDYVAGRTSLNTAVKSAQALINKYRG